MHSKYVSVAICFIQANNRIKSEAEAIALYAKKHSLF